MKNSRCFLQGREQIINFDKDVDNLPENNLALNVDHVFEADECDAFDSDVDEAPNVQTTFMVNLSSEDPIYDEAGPSHDSNTPFENGAVASLKGPEPKTFVSLFDYSRHTRTRHLDPLEGLRCDVVGVDDEHIPPTQSSKSPQSLNEPSPADNFQLDSGSSSTENLIESLSNSVALLTQSYKSHIPQTNNQLRTSSNARNKAMVQDGRVVVQDVRGRYNVNNQGRPFQRNNARGNVVAGNVRGQNRGGIINHGQAKPIKCYNYNGLRHIARECPRPKRLQDSDYLKNKMLLMQAQENGAVIDEEQSLFLAGEHVTNFDDDVDDSPKNDLALNVDHIFEDDQCDAFDSDVDEAPNVQTMFMVNLSSEDPINDEAGPSHDSNTPFEVQDHDTFVDHMDEYHEVHEMQNDVQHNYVVDSNAEYTSDCNTPKLGRSGIRVRGVLLQDQQHKI
ncbi:hypothetical protein Tco_1068620, partial [Tanacetum coccineum]